MTDLIKLLKEVQKPETTHVDLYKRRGRGSLQWFLELDCATHPVYNNNDLQFFVCGEEGFAAIEADIRAATSSIDLVLWGFDPGMELVRKGSIWPRGTTYGDLLTAKAREGVKVRMLLWYGGSIVSYLTKNSPDIGPLSGIPLASRTGEVSAPPPTNYSGPADRTARWALTDRANYCSAWWSKALHGGFANLEVRLRSAHAGAIQQMAQKYLPSEASSLTERQGMKFVGTHHQKPILIDYAAADKNRCSTRNTCAYVMGLNSVSDYWDSMHHTYNDARRELSDHWSEGTTGWHRKPYRDYAIRVEGEALYDINKNFVEGWDSAEGYVTANGAPGALDKKRGPGLASPRSSIKPEHLPRPTGAGCRAQILRTYPDAESGPDATILKAYTLASSNAVNYIYVENQYFQLDAWPRLLKKMRQQYLSGMSAAGASPKDIRPLHIFVVIPQAERDQMVPGTYDTLNQLGQASNMSGYDKQVQGQRKAQAQPQGLMDRVNTAIVNTALTVVSPSAVPEQWLKEQVVQESINAAPPDPAGALNSLGIKTLAAMLMTYDAADEAKNIRIKARDSAAQEARAKQEEEANARPKVNKGQANDVDTENLTEAKIKPPSYREIYIHSKLMLVDDVYTTLGSANLNARSMVGDSEFNICTEDTSFTQSARKRVWGNLAGADLDGKSCTPEETKETFKNWVDQMKTNKDNRKAGAAPVNGSFIHPFEDPRGAPIARLA